MLEQSYTHTPSVCVRDAPECMTLQGSTKWLSQLFEIAENNASRRFLQASMMAGGGEHIESPATPMPFEEKYASGDVSPLMGGLAKKKSAEGSIVNTVV